MQCPTVSPLFDSSQWLLHTGYSLEHFDMTVHKRNHERGDSRFIVLDGIDEALGERFDARWFPRNPGTSLRLVLSGRWQVGDLGSSGWQTRLGWERDVRVQSRE